MKIYLSVDIEGVCGIAHWDEATAGKNGHGEFRERMTAETAAACEAALDAGATDVWVQDAHDSARNLLHERLPKGTTLVRGWSGDSRMMVQELDGTFDALLLLGWHSSAGTGGSPLEHSMALKFVDLRLNGEPASELAFHGWAAAELGVPTVFLSGDEALCGQARRLFPGIETVATHAGRGGSVVARHPETVRDGIRAGVARALATLPERRPVAPPVPLELELRYRRSDEALKASHFPGAEALDPYTVRLVRPSAIELLRALLFLI